MFSIVMQILQKLFEFQFRFVYLLSKLNEKRNFS